ncbi:hypothetical protein [Streptomyces sp. NPDC005012]|uniref:hypothetical protein n=1 Tax=unclassified Streptomyces TaxID=2593676 RepID=UPI0033B29A88
MRDPDNRPSCTQIVVLVLAALLLGSLLTGLWWWWAAASPSAADCGKALAYGAAGPPPARATDLRCEVETWDMTTYDVTFRLPADRARSWVADAYPGEEPWTDGDRVLHLEVGLGETPGTASTVHVEVTPRADGTSTVTWRAIGI